MYDELHHISLISGDFIRKININAVKILDLSVLVFHYHSL